MLWDVVFEFYVKYIFGGFLYVNGNLTQFKATMGTYYVSGGNYSPAFTNTFLCFSLDNVNQTTYLPLGNYLSLIATIITMVVILLLCCALIKKIYNMCAHIIG